MHILSPQDKVALTFTTSERVVLTCELSRVDFPARWYKDGQELEPSESLVVKMEGRKHRLILPAAEVQDSGEFECRTEGVSAFFSVTVRGQQPRWSGADSGGHATLPCGPPAWGPFWEEPGGPGDLFSNHPVLLNPPTTNPSSTLTLHVPSAG